MVFLLFLRIVKNSFGMTNAQFNQVFQKRLLNFVVEVFQFFEAIPSDNSKRIIAYQLGKSASSVGANHRAFCRGRSEKEKFAKGAGKK